MFFQELFGLQRINNNYTDSTYSASTITSLKILVFTFPLFLHVFLSLIYSLSSLYWLINY
jgi:hypothetical protein